MPGSQLLQASDHNTGDVGTEQETLEFSVELKELIDIGHRHDTVVNTGEVRVEIGPTQMSESVPDERGQLVWMVLVATERLH